VEAFVRGLRGGIPEEAVHWARPASRARDAGRSTASFSPGLPDPVTNGPHGLPGSYAHGLELRSRLAIAQSFSFVF